jgi:hypothetical protein
MKIDESSAEKRRMALRFSASFPLVCVTTTAEREKISSERKCCFYQSTKEKATDERVEL